MPAASQHRMTVEDNDKKSSEGNKISGMSCSQE